MRSIQKPKGKKPLIVALTVLVILLLGIGLYIWFAHPFDAPKTTSSGTQHPVNTVDYSPATDQEKQDSDTAKQRIIDQEAKQNNQPQPSTIAITIVRAAQASNGQPLNIRTYVEGATTGTCNATLTRNGQTATGSGTISFSATSYSCSIDITASAFDTGGEWQLSVVANNGTATSPAATQTVTIAK